MDAGKIIQAAFEKVHPGSCNDYMDHPSIQKFIEIFRSEDVANSQKTTLGLAMVISFSCKVPYRA